ncbi:MAG: peptide ABC transporter permease [Chlorobiaceae bacterium]|nr:peptide ABC transporter permease [Chlorobiaceae bacterium]MBA4309543.1 peptide ABC transporter permease [Chlorobiaceae bacterium]
MNFFENLKLSFHSLRANKLRAILTITGIVVGIFSIIVIKTVLTVLQTSIESGVSQLAKNTFQIQKMPAVQMGGPGSRARYRSRPDITLDEYERLKEVLSYAKHVGAEQWESGKIIEFRNKQTNPNISVSGATAEAMLTNNWIVEDGRTLRENDVFRNNPVVILGKEIKEKLFPNISPIGQFIKLDGYLLQVIGVLEAQGQFFGQSRDNFVVLPLSYFQTIYGRRSNSINITVMSYSKLDYNQLIETATGYFRTIRKVPPGDENDFEIFSNESIIAQIGQITSGIEIGAMVVSFIALIAAGIGIMNIMLVSVTERTREIGIRKAVGAKKINILLQFFSEAVSLCFIGGAFGILLGVAVGNIAGMALNAATAVPWDWVFIGFVICGLVGVIFGTYPAYKAANLDPIEALRYE